MCGIVGYAGKRQAAPILLDGLSKLEYRGYDSAGIAVRDGSADPSIIKVGAAVRDDIHGLNWYSSFEAGGFADLQTIAEKFGIEEKSVRKMSAIILGIRVSKSQQLSNWESSRLSDAQLRYAAIDAWVCRQMYLKLMSV